MNLISRRRFGLAAVCASSAVAAFSTDSAGAALQSIEGATPMMNARRHILKAKAIDQTYAIDVMPVVSPLAPPGSVTKLPVVYVLDGNWYFPLVAATSFIFSLGIIPSVLVVGIGYDLGPPAGSAPWMGEIDARRTRDYTPSQNKEWLDAQNARYKQYGATYPAYGTPGGAKAFLSFINDELKPFVAAKYPMADMSDATLVGDSFGGLFALYTLFTAPKSFQRYIAVSPTVFWDNGLLFRLASQLSDATAQLFMSVGSEEGEDAMVRPIRKMDALLKDGTHPNLQCIFRVFEGENHGTVVPSGLSHGLHAVFPKPTKLRELFPKAKQSGAQAP